MMTHQPAFCCFVLSLMLLIGGSEAKFSWKPCDDSPAGSALNVLQLSLTPDPIQTDAFAYADFEAGITRNLTAPLTMSLEINKIVHLFWLYKTEISVPCMSWLGDYGIGSCTYEVCEMCDHFYQLYGCPAEYTDNGIPCTCPFRAGVYSSLVRPRIPVYLDTSSVPLVPNMFLNGDYRTTVRLSDSTGIVGCIEYENSITNI
ncbi:ganglioside GM2 activator-like [Patiria miniata]|uniref:MD-2-related lipid-recognition domain-containing protein n=1 Tax=Patiria miniata TaxID=46514 RepID=A0A914B9Q6_PATMI|nr:ganglioside GM2 activator-like [Patiria miniata]